MKSVPLWIAAIALAIGLSVARADIDGDRFSSEAWRVRISAPVNWRMSKQSSYPSILLWMHRRNPPGKMLLSAERLTSRLTSIEYARKTGKALGKLGFQVRVPQHHAATGAYWIEFDNGKVFLRQALLVSGTTGYSLTLSAPDERTRAQHLRAFDFALRSIQIDRTPAAGKPPADAGATAPDDADSASRPAPTAKPGAGATPTGSAETEAPR